MSNTQGVGGSSSIDYSNYQTGSLFNKKKVSAEGSIFSKSDTNNTQQTMEYRFDKDSTLGKKLAELAKEKESESPEKTEIAGTASTDNTNTDTKTDDKSKSDDPFLRKPNSIFGKILGTIGYVTGGLTGGKVGADISSDANGAIGDGVSAVAGGLANAAEGAFSKIAGDISSIWG